MVYCRYVPGFYCIGCIDSCLQMFPLPTYVFCTCLWLKIHTFSSPSIAFVEITNHELLLQFQIVGYLSHNDFLT